MKTYVIADIHGRLDLLDMALAEIEKNDPAKVIFTGDFIDRGPQSAQVVQRLIDGPTRGWVWSFVRGNHEDMAIDAVEAGQADMWLYNGGVETIQSYGENWEDKLSAHVGWFKTLPRLTWDKHRVYVHAGVDPTRELFDQDQKTTQWHRYKKGEEFGYKDKHVVHGHTPQDGKPELLSGRTNLDTGAVFTDILVIGVFDDDTAGGPVDLIQVQL